MKKILCLFIFFGMYASIALHSQSPVVRWDKAYRGAQDDIVYKVIKAPNSDVILFGHSNSVQGNDRTAPNFGGNDVWVVRTDSMGAKLFDYSFGGSSWEQAGDIIATADGGFLLGISSSSTMSGNKTDSCKGNYDYWIVKVDAQFGIEWQRSFGGSSIDMLTKLLVLPNGNILAVGTSYSGINGNKTTPVYGQSDYWLVAMDSVGNTLWQQTYGGAQTDQISDAMVTSDGNIIIVGASASNINVIKNENAIGYDDYWVLKLDPQGNIIWQNTIGGSLADKAKSIIELPDASILIGGESESWPSGDKTDTGRGFSDYWLVKLNASGSVIWDRTMGSSKVDIFTKLVYSTSNQLILIGSAAAGISGEKTKIGYASRDGWIVVCDTNGNITDDVCYGGNANDDFVDGFVTENDFYLIASSVSNTSGDKTSNSMLSDYWLVRTATDYATVVGRVYFDFNNNGTYDSSDSPFENAALTISPDNLVRFSHSDGTYEQYVFRTGNYATSVVDNMNAFDPAPSQYNGNINYLYQIDSGRDFRFVANSPYNDLSVMINPTTAFRPGFTASYAYLIKNEGNTVLEPVFYLVLDNHLVFQYANIIPDSTLGDTVFFSLPQLKPFESVNGYVTVKVKNGTQAGIVVTSSATVYFNGIDDDIEDNMSDWGIVVTASCDPNEVLVTPDTIMEYEFANPKELYFIVKFQNTGTDTAFTVRIENMLDPLLDENSLEVVATSHPMWMEYNPVSRLIQFHHENILLPDTFVDEPGSHGFVHYKIKYRDTCEIGDIIKNYAAIYFDYNPPVITNTAKVYFESFCDKITNVVASDSTICQTGQITLRNEVPFENLYGSWYVDGGYYSSDSTITLSNLSVGTHTVYYAIDTFTCSVADTVTVTVMAGIVPTATLAGNLFTSNGNFSTYQWFVNGSMIPNATLPSYTVQQNGWYQFAITDAGGCSGISDSMYAFHCNGLLNMQLSDSAFCPESTCMAVNLSQSEYELNYEWILDGNYFSNDSISMISTLTPGTHTIALHIDTLNCNNSISQSIFIYTPVQPTFSYSNGVIICDSNFVVTQWIFNGTPITSAPAAAFNVNVSGWYTFVATDSNGCASLSDSIYIDLSAGLDDVGQNTFSLYPNPTEEFITLHIPFLIEGAYYSIVDLYGREVMSAKLNSTSSSVAVQHLPSQLYLLRLHNGTNTMNELFFKR